MCLEHLSSQAHWSAWFFLRTVLAGGAAVSQRLCAMGKAISNDLRARLVCGVGAGKLRRAVAAQFAVAPSTPVRVLARFEETGSVAPAPQGRPKGGGKLAPFKDAILARVKARPDITMPRRAVWLAAEHGVSAAPSPLSPLLCAAGVSDKNASGIGERTL